MRRRAIERLARLFARMDGAQLAAQAARGVYDQARQEAYQAMLEVLEDDGVPPPEPGVRTEFDAVRGRLVFIAEERNGVVLHA